MIAVSDLPAVNAALNATAAILIGAGVYFIKRKNIPAHKACMVAALAVSILFLTSYLSYHYNVGNVRFTKQGWIRNVYFSSAYIAHDSGLADSANDSANGFSGVQRPVS